MFGLTRPGIEPVSTASVADALSTRPLIGLPILPTQLRSSLPILPTQLKPSWKVLRGFRTKDKHIRAQQKCNFDKCHRVRDLPFLNPNTYLWIDTPTSGHQPGVVQHSHHTPRSYIVKTESRACSSLCRNRRHITPLPLQSNH